MLLLALDTAMAACSVAVLRQGVERPLAQALVPMEKGHAEALPPLVQQVLADAGIAFAALDRITVTTGPGTFTGVRIGLAFARGLGLALNIPVIGIDTLTAIAANEDHTVPRLVVADARKDEVYAALIDAEGHVLQPPAVMPRHQAAVVAPAGTLVMGTAADAVLADARQLQRSRAGDLPVAARFGVLAYARQPEGMPAPLYLRAADAKPQAGYVVRPLLQTFSRVDHEAAPLLALMHGECFDNPWNAAAIESLIAMPGALALVARNGDEPTGFVIARQAADEAEIITIGTRPFAQRQGTAKCLVDQLAAMLQATGTTQLFLEVAASNSAARALYTAAGFAEAGARKGYYDRGAGLREDAVVMRKQLKP